MSLNYPSYLRDFEILPVIIIIAYGSLSYSLTTKKYNTMGWVEDIVVEYEFLKKLLFISLPLLIIVTFVFIIIYQPLKVNFTYALLPGLSLIAGGTILRFTSNITKKNFRFYYAKGCVHQLLRTTDQAEKMNLLVRALISYNKYLKRTLKLQINNIDSICSKIISDQLLDKPEFVNSISSAFQGNDKLKPTALILNFLKIQKTDQFFIKEPLSEKIKEWGALSAAIIPVVISMIQFILAIV
jgi:hypothetical protein